MINPPMTETESHVVYLAQAGMSYEPPYVQAVFTNRGKAASWLDEIRFSESRDYDWIDISQIVLDEPSESDTEFT